jgi:hypothetical protein
MHSRKLWSTQIGVLADFRSLAILDTESHAFMHNQAQKQSLTLFGKLDRYILEL